MVKNPVLFISSELKNMENDLPYSGREIYSPKSNVMSKDPLDMDCSETIRVQVGQRVRITFLAFDVEKSHYDSNW